MMDSQRNMNKYLRSNPKRWIVLIICVRNRDVYHTCGSSESSLTCWPSHESRLHPILFGLTKPTRKHTLASLSPRPGVLCFFRTRTHMTYTSATFDLRAWCWQGVARPDERPRGALTCRFRVTSYTLLLADGQVRLYSCWNQYLTCSSMAWERAASALFSVFFFLFENIFKTNFSH
jgi:hypothetical protein